MRRLGPVVCSTVLAFGVVAGCGSDDGGGSDSNAGGSASGGDYCSQVEDMKAGFEDVSSGDASVADMRSTADQIESIAGSAPSEVSSEWESIRSAMDEMVSQLEDVGLDTEKPLQQAAEDFAKKEPEKAQEFVTEFQKIASGMEEIKADGDAIQKQVKDECDIELSSGTEQE